MVDDTLYHIVVKGNQEDPKGNAIPYHRTTQGSYWNAGSRRYKAWKDYVAREFCRANDIQYIGNKPIANKGSDTKYYVDVSIFFANKRHADGDNVFKGINDALFENDKYVAGSFDFSYDKKNPRVEVWITNPTLQ